MTNSDAVLMDNITIQNINSKSTQDAELTPVQKFYKNTNILVTGSTGFLGNILTEKLLRSCPGISTLYLLVRSKKGKNMHTRVDEIFDEVIFDRLKKECPKFRHKVVGIAGDCSLPNLGLSLQDQQIIKDEVNIIFHVAATVRFDEKLQMAVAINIRATQDLVHLARQVKNLKAMMHVSTAFANCINKVIEEKIYPTSMDFKKLMLVTENLPDQILEQIAPMILDKYPNTYAFTKQIAEDVIKQEAQDLPIGILRPAVVVSTYKEPVVAWINNMYGATGVAAGAGVGVLRVLHCDPEANANIVPVDMCVNSIIAATWEIGTTFEKCKREKKPYEIPVYNFESSNDRPINWKDFMAVSSKYGLLTPTVRSLWYYCFSLQKNYALYLFMTFFLHTLPAFLADGVLVCLGQTPRLRKIYSKIHKFSNVLSYFSTQEWTFKSKNVQNLVRKMTQEDNEIFFCDLKKLVWNDFFYWYLRGVRIYLIKDPIETLPEAKKKFQRLYWAHNTLKALLGLILLRILWSLFSFIYSYIF